MSEFVMTESRLSELLDQAVLKGMAISHPGMNLDNGISRTHDAPTTKGAGDIMNHRQRLSINGTSKWISYSGAQDLVDQVIAESSKQTKQAELTFGEYAADWYKSYKQHTLSYHTAQGFLSKMKLHVFPFIGDKPINSVSRLDVQNIVNSCTSASSAKWARSIVNMVLDAAIQDELYTHPNPAKDKRIIMPKASEKRKPLPHSDIAVIQEALPHLTAETAPLLALMYMTGSRRGEALGACWEDIDWEKHTIHLQRVVRYRNNRAEVSSKMKTPSANRTVSLWPELVPFLGKPLKEGFIVHKDGEPLTEREYRTRWKNLQQQLSAVGLSARFTAHQLRHTYATVAANSGNVPPKVLQGMLGHANFQTTMNIYAGLDDEKMRESSRQMEAEYAKVASKSCKQKNNTSYSAMQ